jgi:hypothetical protein
MAAPNLSWAVTPAAMTATINREAFQMNGFVAMQANPTFDAMPPHHTARSLSLILTCFLARSCSFENAWRPPPRFA